MPAGLLARLLAPLAGWAAPPRLADRQRPARHRPDRRAGRQGTALPAVERRRAAGAARTWRLHLRGWLASGATLGYRARAVWWRVLWPLLLPRLALAAAGGAGLQPDGGRSGADRRPGLAADAGRARLARPAGRRRRAQRRGRRGCAAAGVVLLVLVLGGRADRAHRSGGPGSGSRSTADAARTRCRPARVARAAAAPAWSALYAVVALLLAVRRSVAGVWTFPSLLPQAWTAEAWLQVRAAGAVLGLSAGAGVRCRLSRRWRWCCAGSKPRPRRGTRARCRWCWRRWWCRRCC